MMAGGWFVERTKELLSRDISDGNLASAVENARMLEDDFDITEAMHLCSSREHPEVAGWLLSMGPSDSDIRGAVANSWLNGNKLSFLVFASEALRIGVPLTLTPVALRDEIASMLCDGRIPIPAVELVVSVGSPEILGAVMGRGVDVTCLLSSDISSMSEDPVIVSMLESVVLGRVCETDSDGVQPEREHTRI